MTEQEISAAYWSGSIIDNKIVWTHKNIMEFFASQGIEWNYEITSLFGSCDFTSVCGKCGRTGLKFSATSRSKLQALARAVLRDGRGECGECAAERQAAAEAAAKIAAEKAAAEEAAQQAEKAANLELHRKAMELKYGVLLTGELCPVCKDGYLVVRLNSTQMRPFLSCSRFNPYRSSACKASFSMALEHHEKHLKVFRARLKKKGVAA